MANLTSYNPIPGSPSGIVTQTIPGGGGATTKANAPYKWAASGFYQPNAAREGSVGTDPAQQTKTPTADMTLPSQNSKMESYTSQVGQADYAGAPAGGGGSGSPSLTAMRSLAGMAPGGDGGGAIGGLGVMGPGAPASIGALDGSGAGQPLASTPPETPNAPAQMPPDMNGQQYLTGPSAGRQSIGNRVPPSLAALLKPRVY